MKALVSALNKNKAILGVQYCENYRKTFVNTFSGVDMWTIILSRGLQLKIRCSRADWQYECNCKKCCMRPDETSDR